jgi:FhaA, N-terminal domain/FHA domain
MTSSCFEEVSMGVLQRFERRIEGMVNGAFARAFKAEVQPVEIASALQRELDDRAAIVAQGRTLVPNDFVVELSERDSERLGGYADQLAAELVDMVRGHADQQRYAFVGPVEVAFEQASDLQTGVFRVRSSAKAGVTPMQQPTSGPPGHSAPSPFRAEARLIISGTPYPLSRQVTVLGRGTEADLRIDDPGVSRKHAQISISGDTAVVTDLGSTNGTLVDGQRVGQAALVDGTEIRLGSTTAVFQRPRDGG